MTPVILLERLKEFVQENTKDIILTVAPIKNKTLQESPPRARAKANDPPPDEPDVQGEDVTERAAEVHLLRLPSKDAETNRIPYVLMQFMTGKDEQQPSKPPDSEVNIRLIFATYSDNDSEGAMDVLNLITKTRTALLKAGEIGEQFLLRQPLEYMLYPDDTQPYFFGEMMVTFEMPPVIREVHTHFMDE